MSLLNGRATEHKISEPGAGVGGMEQGMSKMFPYELSRKNIQVGRKESKWDEESSFEMELPNTDFENTK